MVTSGFLSSTIGFSRSLWPQNIGFYLIKQRFFECFHFKCYFHLWGFGGPNWRDEFACWNSECEKQWIHASKKKHPAMNPTRATPTKRVGSSVNKVNAPKVASLWCFTTILRRWSLSLLSPQSHLLSLVPSRVCIRLSLIKSLRSLPRLS